MTTRVGFIKRYVRRFWPLTAVNYTLLIVVCGDHSFTIVHLSMESNLVINCSPDNDTHVTLGSSQQLIELWIRVVQDKSGLK